jgi:hypothetical protein
MQGTFSTQNPRYLAKSASNIHSFPLFVHFFCKFTSQFVHIFFVFIHIPASNVKKEFFLVWGREKVTLGLFEE